MKLGKRKTKYSSLELSTDAGLPDGVIVVSSVSVSKNHRKRGYGTYLMRSICAQADYFGKVLLLEAKPFDDSIDQQSLEKWYHDRFGFVTIQQEPKLMARQPNQTRILRSA